jgi:hypothetical protein
MDLLAAFVSDTHTGSTTSLMPESFVTQDGQRIWPSEAQQWLLNNWINYWDYVGLQCFDINGSRVKDLFIGHLGDMIDGFHHNTVQSIPNIVDQENMFKDVFEIPLRMANRGIAFTIGTDPHSGANGASEVRIAASFLERFRYTNNPCPIAIGQKFTVRCKQSGYNVDIGHHGRSSRRHWTSAAANLGSEVSLDYIMVGNPPPSLILRGHTHTIDDSGIKLPVTRCITMPAWQLRTSFGYKVASGRVLSDIGGLVVNMTEQKVDDTKMRYIPEEIIPYLDIEGDPILEEVLL